MEEMETIIKSRRTKEEGEGARTEEKNLIGGRVFFFLPRPSTGLSGGYNA